MRERASISDLFDDVDLPGNNDPFGNASILAMIGHPPAPFHIEAIKEYKAHYLEKMLKFIAQGKLALPDSPKLDIE